MAHNKPRMRWATTWEIPKLCPSKTEARKQAWKWMSLFHSWWSRHCLCIQELWWGPWRLRLSSRHWDCWISGWWRHSAGTFWGHSGCWTLSTGKTSSPQIPCAQLKGQILMHTVICKFSVWINLGRKIWRIDPGWGSFERVRAKSARLSVSLTSLKCWIFLYKIHYYS